MASTYSTNLALELIGTGDQAGTWGVTTNTNLGTLIEQAVSGYVTQAITDGADTTITIPNGATGVARNMYIEMTGALTAARNLIVPANKKLYFIYNNTTGGYAVTVKVSGQTGVSVPNGAKVVLVSNGTDVVSASNYLASLTLGSALGVASGGTGAATLTGIIKGSGTSALSAATANTDYLIPALANTAVSGFKTATFNSQTTISTTTGSITIDWTTAQNQKQNEPTGTITYTFTDPPGPCHLQLLIDSDGTSTAQTINWPSLTWIGSTWAGTNNKKAIINFWFDGTNYFAQGSNQV